MVQSERREPVWQRRAVDGRGPAGYGRVDLPLVWRQTGVPRRNQVALDPCAVSRPQQGDDLGRAALRCHVSAALARTACGRQRRTFAADARYARRFSATLIHPRRGTNTLRLVRQAVYRYEQTPQDVIDGGMFAFVQGTDPEVFLIVEAVKTAEGPRWGYAVSGMNMQ